MIISLGIMVADLIGGPVQTLPEKGGLVLVDRMSLYPGGCAVNTAIILARLGFQVKLVGKIGADRMGSFLLTALGEEGIDTSGVRRAESVGTSATMVMIDPDGERRFVHCIGANSCLTQRDIDLAMFDEAEIFHVGGVFVMPGLDGQPMNVLLQKAKEAGVITFLDTAWDASGRWMSLLGPALPFIDYFVPNLAEAQALTGRQAPVDVASFLVDRGVCTVALKMGADGCLVMSGDGQAFTCPTYRVEVVDATGAGDAFAAGFIAGISLGWSLEETARLANATGALCVIGFGAQGGLKSMADTLAFMASAESSPETHRLTSRQGLMVENGNKRGGS